MINENILMVFSSSNYSCFSCFYLPSPRKLLQLKWHIQRSPRDLENPGWILKQELRIGFPYKREGQYILVSIAIYIYIGANDLKFLS